MRKDIIEFVILIFFTSIAFSQTTITKGHYNAVRGDSIGKNRTTKDKAIMDCYGLSLTNTANEEIYYTMPERVVVTFPEVVSNFEILAILEKNVSPTSITIDIQLNSNDVVEAYVRFRKVGGLWQRTNSDPVNVYWIGLLESKTVYEYMVYAKNSKGIKINSDLLQFTTL